VLLVVAGGAYYLGGQKDKQPTVKKSDSIEVSSVSLKSQDTDEYTTFTDTKEGYTLKYPKTWTAKMNDGVFSKDYPGPTGMKYHYLTFTPTDKQYSFHLGLAKKDDNVSTWGHRTGMGGEGFEKGETINVAGTDIQVMHTLIKNDIYEFFFNSQGATPKVINGNYQLTAYLSYFPKDVMADVKLSTKDKEYIEAKKILESIEFTTK